MPGRMKLLSTGHIVDWNAVVWKADHDDGSHLSLLIQIAVHAQTSV